ncbi:substrate-binding periplasmic protein [Zooshikella ganghwensis]|uniref:substrate-binding periplasmic protein n=1 Tax=Zooshikella ganghwensis TaxID=202772 RepID=UPI001F308A43|nr:transporter substrate-binding domain-containing protein [Zooshikella ganghwensis]
MIKILPTTQLIILMLSLFKTTYSCAVEVKITIGEWLPFIGEKLPHYGVVPHIITEVFSEFDVRVKYGFYPWQRSYKYVQSGEWNASAIWGKTEERTKDCYFSDVVYSGESVLFFLKDRPLEWSGDSESLYKLKNITIGLSRGSAKGELLKKAEQKGLIKYSIGSDKTSTFRMLLAKRFDALDENKAVGLNIMYTQLDEPQRLKIHFTNTYEQWDYYVIFSKKIDENKKFLKLFNEGLHEMKMSGVYDKFWRDFERGKYSMVE